MVEKSTDSRANYMWAYVGPDGTRHLYKGEAVRAFEAAVSGAAPAAPPAAPTPPSASGLVTFAEGVKLHLSDRSSTGYKGVGHSSTCGSRRRGRFGGIPVLEGKEFGGHKPTPLQLADK